MSASAIAGCPASHSPETDAFWQRFRELSCAQVAPCAAPSSVNAWIAAAPELDCFDVWGFAELPTVDPARVRLDPTLTADCLARVETSCHGNLAMLCPGVLVGLQPAGAPCRLDQECIDGTYCSYEADVDACEGRCVARPTSGPCQPGCAACTDDVESRCLPAGPRVELASGERCDDGTITGVCPALHYCVETCRPFPGEGETCGEYWPICAAGLGCSDGVCRPTRVAALGEACDEVLVFCDRFHGAACVDGTCAPRSGCGPEWEEIDCGPGEHCDGDRHVCLPDIPVGGACTGWGNDCADGGRCIDGICSVRC